MSIIIMLLLLSVLILVHVAGHFLAAKMFKMRVARFGFGLPIGPTLWEKQIGDVKVLIHAFLLGGYVAFPDDDKELNLPKDSPDRFLNRPVYQRLVVVSAGVFANVVCAFLIVVLAAAIWGHMPSGRYDIYVKDIVADKTASISLSGIQKGDKIVEINEMPVTTSTALVTTSQLSKKNDGKADEAFINENYEKLKKLNPVFEKDEVIPNDILVKLPERKTESPVNLSRNVLNGLEKYKDTQLSLSDTQKILRDKLTEKKYIISDGTFTLNDLAYALSDSSRPVYMTVLRGGKLIELKPVYPNEDGIMGLQMEIKEVLIPTKDFKSIIVTSTKYLWEQTSMLLYGLYQIFTGKIPLKDLHGIVAITKVGGDIIDTNGMFSGLLLTALISLDLAIVNFLPIPALDGGHVLFLLIEKLRGRPLDEETVDKIGTAGFMILIALMVLVVFNDIYALITQKL